MQKKLSPATPKLRAEIKNNLRSWHLCERNGWFIKLSIHREVNILLMFISRYTAQTIVRYFTCEDDAVNYINFVIDKSAENRIKL